MTEQQDAVVTATYGRRWDVRRADGSTVSARIKGRSLRPVCGDHVGILPIENEPEWLIVDVHERRNELTRPNQRGQTEVLAANLDFVAVTCAAVPKPDWFIVDRYLCAAELMGVRTAVVFNKADDGNLDPAIDAELDEYRKLGYEALLCSARTGHNLLQLEALLAGQLAIIVGQSGVGKSSLINAITDAEQRTAAVSTARGGDGRHTTVNSVMLSQPRGGYVVDSPGVRDYAPAINNPAEVEYGFREIHRHGENCHFANCRHRQEPKCAVKAALETDAIDARRYESYKRMLLLTEQKERGRY